MTLFSVKELVKRFPLFTDWLFRVILGLCGTILVSQTETKILQYFWKEYGGAKHFKVFLIYLFLVNLKINDIHKCTSFNCLNLRNHISKRQPHMILVLLLNAMVNLSCLQVLRNRFIFFKKSHTDIIK